MNYENCSSSLFATDQLFVLRPVGTCDVSIIAAGIFCSVILLLRIFAVILRLRALQKSRQERLNPALHSLMVPVYATLISLMLSGYVSAATGTGFLMTSIPFAIFFLYHSLTLFRVVRLGFAIGLTKTSLTALRKSSRTPTNSDQKSQPSPRAHPLAHLDGFGMILYGIATMCFIGMQVICTFILPSISPSDLQTTTLLIKLGFVFYGISIGSLTSCVSWHLQRCRVALQFRLQDSSPHKFFILYKLRRSQCVFSGFGISAMVLWVTVGVAWASEIPWWMGFGVSFSVETIAALVNGITWQPSNNSMLNAQRRFNSAMMMQHSNHQAQNPQYEDPTSASISNSFLPVGLHIRNRKYRIRKFIPRISHVTEVSEVGHTSHRANMTLKEDSEIDEGAEDRHHTAEDEDFKRWKTSSRRTPASKNRLEPPTEEDSISESPVANHLVQVPINVHHEETVDAM